MLVHIFGRAWLLQFRKNNAKETYLAFKGPKGVYVLVTALTDDLPRTKSELNKITRKYK